MFNGSSSPPPPEALCKKEFIITFFRKLIIYNCAGLQAKGGSKPLFFFLARGRTLQELGRLVSNTSVINDWPGIPVAGNASLGVWKHLG